MSKSHIIDILDSAPVASLSEAQMVLVRAHIETCASCAHSFEAASLTSQVIHERVAIVIEPSPFFATKVLARVREEQAENVHVLLRLWRSARFLVSSMAATTAALAVLSFVIPSQTIGTETISAHPALSVILGDEEDQLSYEQILSTIYEEDEEANTK
jgi:hypothetical protein